MIELGLGGEDEIVGGEDDRTGVFDPSEAPLPEDMEDRLIHDASGERLSCAGAGSDVDFGMGSGSDIFCASFQSPPDRYGKSFRSWSGSRSIKEL